MQGYKVEGSGTIGAVGMECHGGSRLSPGERMDLVYGEF